MTDHRSDARPGSHTAGGEGAITAEPVPPSSWGPDDQTGAANRLTQELVGKALRLARAGRVYDLSFPVSKQAPTHPVYLTPYFICLNHLPWASEKYEREHAGATNGIGWAQERVELDMHTGTHVDALGHATVSGQAYNQFPLLEVYGNWGLMKLGIENLPPLLTRGILADVAGHRGSAMQPGDAISAAELQDVLRAQRVGVRPGDVVLVRTGWARYWGVDNDRYMLNGCPGISLDAATWLAGRGVIAVGADQAAVEVWPAERPGDVFPVHIELLTRSGVYLIEQANLEEIARASVYEFLLVCATPKFAGATGAPVRLLAVT
jgi:kynurenine formamidase